MTRKKPPKSERRTRGERQAKPSLEGPGDGGRVVFVTGLSGSGKTVAMQAFEDLGFFCVDNLPANLIDAFADFSSRRGNPIERIALAVDIRERGLLKHFPGALARLRRRGMDTTVVFLEARDEVLLRRYTVSRRPHPLSNHRGSLLDTIRTERRRLASLRRLSDRIVDTSDLSPSELRQNFLEHFSRRREERLTLRVVSFGYKYGLPPDAELVFDVRFLPNPYFHEKLRSKSGAHPAVEGFLQAYPGTARFLERLESFLTGLLPEFQAEKRSRLTVAVGCTGGRHRSVMVANALGRRLRQTGRDVVVDHRDVENET